MQLFQDTKGNFTDYSGWHSEQRGMGIEFRLNGISDNISKQGQNELVGALLQYIKCTDRFRQI